MDIVARGSVVEFAPVFRQLLVYDYLIRKIAEAGIKEVRQLELPLGFAVQEEDIYTVTPIWLSFDCEQETVQKFLNQMTNDRKMLFYIKNISLIAPDTVTAVAQDYQNANAEHTRQTVQAVSDTSGMDMMMMPGEDGQRRPDTQRRVNPFGGRMTNPAEPGGGETVASAAVQSRLVVPDPKRQDYLVFARKYVTANPGFDLYEFKNLKQDKEVTAWNFWLNIMRS